MKILDEKGRLFGKINLIDLIVILVLVFIVAAVGWKLAGNRIASAVENLGGVPTVRYEVLCTNVDPDTCDYAVAHIGEQLMSNGDMVDAHITDCVIEPNYTTCLDNNGNALQVENPAAYNLRFTIEANVPKTNNAYAVGSQEIRVGKAHIVKTVLLEINGSITSMEEENANG